MTQIMMNQNSNQLGDDLPSDQEALNESWQQVRRDANTMQCMAESKK